jgi:redox-sensitive bicupin YhaK (pirin superfamily)
MKYRTVTNLLYGEKIDMDGFPVRQAFPTARVEHVDPFLLVHHADTTVPDYVKPGHAGVGPHPHRGFSPVTFVFRGGVHHRDSRGNDSVVYAGGAQWMNAGMGIMHSERPPVDISDYQGRQEIIQLWINTPAAHKMDQPEYFALQKQDIPFSVTDDGLARVNVVAGELVGIRGPVSAKSVVNVATLELKKGGALEIALPSEHNAFLYTLDGKLTVGGYGLIDGLHAAVFARDGEGIRLEALEETRLLLASGVPLNEKVVAQGPFVMNSETQILEAMRDYRMGKMGILIED